MRFADAQVDLFGAATAAAHTTVEHPDHIQPALKERLHAEALDGEGRMLASSEAVRALSLPPYYTACPNPFLAEGLASDPEPEPRTDQPHTDDVAVGKNDPLYFAHAYSTKVPPQAILPYLHHYTEPGDVILDGFCGTGMTGVAAQLCADPSLAPKGARVGARRAILGDLSPAATFIAAGTNALGLFLPHLDRLETLIDDVEREYEALLTTRHVGWARKSDEPRRNREAVRSAEQGWIEYVVWSDVFSCPSCGGELTHWDLVFSGPGESAPKEVACPHCDHALTTRSLGRELDRIWTTRFDPVLGETVRQAKQVPVMINYRAGSARYEKHPDEVDRTLLERLDQEAPGVPLPVVELQPGFNTNQPRGSHGFTHVHHFFTPRNRVLMGAMWERVRRIEDPVVRNAGLYLLTGCVQRVCRLNRYMPNHDRHVGPLSGTLYVAPLTAEIPATSYARSRIADLRRCAGPHAPTGAGVRITTQSATALSAIPDDSIDYVFTDPPFGGNLNYSELNVLVEAWLGVRTDADSEAVVNDVQGKDLLDYKHLMEAAFREYYRVLKPGRWITVEFNNSANAVWNAIQQALLDAGFGEVDVRVLDKKKGTTKQLSYTRPMKQDLVISAYKPSGDFERRFAAEAGSEAGVWLYVRERLAHLPMPKQRGDRVEVIAERRGHALFNRVVALHLSSGLSLPLSSAAFLDGLDARFEKDDETGMYFLPDQMPDYRQAVARAGGVEQLKLFVEDESSAVAWLRQRLKDRPQTYQEIQPDFMKEVRAWGQYERALELQELLEQNFLRYEGKGPVPSQIHAYLSSNFHDLRGLDKEDPALQSKARERWYVPDPSKAEDLERVREKALLREFDDYVARGGKRLREFRREALRAGFRRAHKNDAYETIVEMAERIPEEALYADSVLLRLYDIARNRTGEGAAAHVKG